MSKTRHLQKKKIMRQFFKNSFSTSFGVLACALVWGGFFCCQQKPLQGQDVFKEIFPATTNSADKAKTKARQWPPRDLPSEFKKLTPEKLQEKKRLQELLQESLAAFQYPEGRTYAVFSTLDYNQNYNKNTVAYKLLLWTNAQQTSLFSVLHTQNGLQERIRFFAGKEYMHIFWTSRQKLLTRNIVTDIRSRFEIALENSNLYFSDLHPVFLLSQYDIILDEFEDIFSKLDTVRGKTLPHARRYLFEQIRQNAYGPEYQVVTLQSKIAAMHDIYALNQKPFDSLREEKPPTSYYGYLVAYIKDKKIHVLEHFDSNGYFLKSVRFEYGTLPVKDKDGKIAQSIEDFPLRWQITEPARKKITRVEFLYHLNKLQQSYYFSDDYFTRP